MRDKKIPTCRVSSIEKSGFEAVVQLLKDSWSKDKEGLVEKRCEQDSLWLEKYVQMSIMLGLKDRLSHSAEFQKMRSQVASGAVELRSAVKLVIDSLKP